MVDRISQNIKLKVIEKEFANKKILEINDIDILPIKKDTIKVAKKVLNNFTITPEVFPTFRGTIQFEFEYQDIYLEFELIRKTKKEYILKWIKMIGEEEIDNGTITSRDYVKMNKLVVDSFADICF